MKVNVALEHRFLRLPDGTVWTQAQCAFPFWQRYLDVFDEVRCVARVLDVPSLEGEWQRADGPGVTVSAIPHYVGPAQYVMKAMAVRAAVRRSFGIGDAAILRVPGNLGTLAFSKLHAMKYPFAAEVVGDPYDVFSPGAVKHPLRPYFRWRMTTQLKQQCASACAVSYVTARALQQKYPPASYTISASSIDLRDSAFSSAPRVFSGAGRPTRLIFVGSLEHYHKAPDLLVQALAACVADGLDVNLTMIGDGKRRADLEALAGQLGCADRVVFAGQLPSTLVAAELDKADLFVLPSRHEGLPRAMIEAMARGLPCIGSDVAGIPELVPPEAIVPAGNLDALTARIQAFVRDPAFMTRMSKRNLDESAAYRSATLQARRVGFYEHLRQTTQVWLNAHAGRQ